MSKELFYLLGGDEMQRLRGPDNDAPSREGQRGEALSG
jgi:hypothetical protein